MKVQKLLSLIRQSCERYGMIEEGDKIAVGVSGGKDSLTLQIGRALWINRTVTFLSEAFYGDGHLGGSGLCQYRFYRN